MDTPFPSPMFFRVCVRSSSASAPTCSELTVAVQGQEPDIGLSMSLVLASRSLFGLGIFGLAIASGLVSGAPQLGAVAALGTTLGAAGMTMLAGGAAVGGARALGGGAIGRAHV